MSNVSGTGTVWNLPNYTGILYLIGAVDTPFLNMIGGLQGNRIRLTRAFEFPVASPWALESASQPNITETDSLTAPTPTSYTRGQDTNTVQIFHESVTVSYAKQSVMDAIVADATTGLANAGENQPVQNEEEFQITANLQQIAVDVEYTFLNGAYVKAINAGVGARSRGIITATTTNAVAAGGAYLSRTNFNTLLRTMAGNGSKFRQCVIFVNGFQKQKLTEIFGQAPLDYNVGGVAIEQIVTDFARLGVVWAPFIPVDTLLVADLSVCSPVFCQVPGKGVLFYEPLSKTGAANAGQIYGQIGLDYGPEEYHGKITGLAYA
jgi:hypothetical protein